MRSLSEKNGWTICREIQSQKTGSHTLTKDTRGVSNIEENSTDDSATVKKLFMQAEKEFPSGNVFVAYEFMVTQIPQKLQ